MTDHSDMLATLTDTVATLTRRVEALERIEADNVCLGLAAAGTDLHDRHCSLCSHASLPTCDSGTR